MEYVSVTLEDMLESKEDRAFYQSYLIDKYKCPLISFTVVMPGSVKRNEMSEKIFSKGKAALEAALGGYNIIFKNERQKNTGLEAFYCVDLDARELKKLTVSIEDECRFNRLFDFDVIDICKKPISRTMLGLVGRKCLICGEPAHACARSRKHSVDELLKEIKRVLLDEYKISKTAKK